MIKECNFKTRLIKYPSAEKYLGCDLTGGECKEEDNCILFQIYKSMNFTDEEKKMSFVEYFKHREKQIKEEKKPLIRTGKATIDPNDPGPYTKDVGD